jgi:hypothetical protein
MTLNPMVVMSPPLNLKQNLEEFKNLLRSLYTSDNTKTLMDLKQNFWRSSRIYEVFIYVG